MEERIQKMEAESQERIQNIEKSMEEEKESLVQELSKAKAAAISCMQVTQGQSGQCRLLSVRDKAVVC
jgi:hypothetical protein